MKLVFSVLSLGLFLMSFRVEAFSVFNRPSLSGTDLVFIDIIKTTAKMTVSEDMRDVVVEARMTFTTESAGKPLFFLNMSTESSVLNGKTVKIKRKSFFDENNSASFMDRVVPAGTHTLVIKGRFLRSAVSNNQFVRIDYIEGDYTEAALPANFMYDFYKLSIDFELESSENYKLIGNGEVRSEGRNTFTIDFPETYNSSYFFMDFVPTSKMLDSYSLTSVDGRPILVNIYLQKAGLESLGTLFKQEIGTAFSFLETSLGPYPYNSLQFKVLDNDRGGAFAGALMLNRPYSEDGWVIHELAHSWFLKGVSPENGYDAWFYEGFAEWARYKFPRAERAFDQRYRRALRYRPGATRQKLAEESWDKGRIVLSCLDKFLEEQGGLLPLMKELHYEKKGQAVGTDSFFKFLESKTGLKFAKFRSFYFK